MEDQRLGAVFRAVRVRRHWRQEDVAARSGVSRALVSLVERGHTEQLSLMALRRIGAALDVRVDLAPRWRGGELDRLLNAGHSALHEAFAQSLDRLPHWIATPEVSFSVYGERGVIDAVCWHPVRRALLVVELKTEIVDVQALLGTVHRYRRLARRIVAEQGWEPATVSAWVIVLDTKTNRRRVDAHRSVLRAAFPLDGRTVRHWLHDPERAVAALSFWTIANPRSATGGMPGRQRVRRRTGAIAEHGQLA